MFVSVATEQGRELVGGLLGKPGLDHVGGAHAGRQPAVTQHLADTVVGQGDGKRGTRGVDGVGTPGGGVAAAQLGGPVGDAGPQVQIDQTVVAPASLTHGAHGTPSSCGA